MLLIWMWMWLLFWVQRQQLSLLLKAQRNVIRKSRSPIRSPGAVTTRIDTLRTMAHLKALAAHSATQ